jgi:hypothetical protein
MRTSAGYERMQRAGYEETYEVYENYMKQVQRDKLDVKLRGKDDRTPADAVL